MRPLACRVATLLACGLLAACEDQPATLPPEIVTPLEDGGEIIVSPDPLTIRYLVEGDERARVGVEVGVADAFEATAYYDPAAPPTDVRFRRATRATAWDGSSGTLTLALDGEGDGTARLGLSAAGLRLETDGVPDAVLARFVLPLAEGEELHGLGELLDTPASRGVVREMQLRVDLESESSTNEVHVPVPLAIYPRRQIAALAEEVRPGAFDVGRERPAALLITFLTRSLHLRLLAGDALAVLDRATAGDRRPALPPEWAFLPMLWRNDNTDGAEVLADAEALRALDLPGSTVWIDNPWQTGYNTLEFAPDRFPDAGALVDALGDLGFHVILWSTPYLAPEGPTAADYLEAAGAGYLVLDDRGRPFDWPWQNGPGALIDFTAPGAADFWRQRIARATTLGVRGFKLDFAEDLVPELAGSLTPFQLHGGGTDVHHNLYARGYHEAYLGALPAGDGFLITRAGALGTQAVTTCVWPGDLDNDFSRHEGGRVGGLPAAIAAGLSLSASGFPFFGSDIGGFRGGVPDGETLIRWAEYAALGTILQLGGGGGRGTSHNPWDAAAFGPDALPIYRTYARLHTDLLPYLYTHARRAAETGRPVTVAPGLLHPGHPYEDAFLTGDALFVAPVVEAGATTRTVTLPPGADWVDVWSGARTPGGVAVTVEAPLDRLPLWRRVDGIVVMLGAAVDTTLPATAPDVVSLVDPEVGRLLRVLVTPDDVAAFALHDGATVSTRVADGALTVAASAGSRYRDFRFEIDWANGALGGAAPTTASVPPAADRAALDACPAPGCWLHDATTGLLLVRLVDVGPHGAATVQE